MDEAKNKPDRFPFKREEILPFLWNQRHTIRKHWILFSIIAVIIVFACGYLYSIYYENKLKSKDDVIAQKDASIERLKTTLEIADKEINKLPEKLQNVDRVAKDIAAIKVRVENYEAEMRLIANDSASIRKELSNSLSGFQTNSDVVMSNINDLINFSLTVQNAMGDSRASFLSLKNYITNNSPLKQLAIRANNTIIDNVTRDNITPIMGSIRWDLLGVDPAKASFLEMETLYLSKDNSVMIRNTILNRILNNKNYQTHDKIRLCINVINNDNSLSALCSACAYLSSQSQIYKNFTVPEAFVDWYHNQYLKTNPPAIRK